MRSSLLILFYLSVNSHVFKKKCGMTIEASSAGVFLKLWRDPGAVLKGKNRRGGLFRIKKALPVRKDSLVISVVIAFRTPLRGLFYRFYEGPGLLQGLFHFFDRDYFWIIINGIYLFKGTKAFFYSEYAFEPFQGLFAYIKSRDDKNNFRVILPGQCPLAYEGDRHNA
jgi:hypothetical protein